MRELIELIVAAKCDSTGAGFYRSTCIVADRIAGIYRLIHIFFDKIGALCFANVFTVARLTCIDDIIAAGFLGGWCVYTAVIFAAVGAEFGIEDSRYAR